MQKSTIYSPVPYSVLLDTQQLLWPFVGKLKKHTQKKTFVKLKILVLCHRGQRNCKLLTEMMESSSL